MDAKTEKQSFEPQKYWSLKGEAKPSYLKDENIKDEFKKTYKVKKILKSLRTIDFAVVLT